MSDRYPVRPAPPSASRDDLLYIADADLKVVFVNAAWRAFARFNRGGMVLENGWNHDLLASFSGSGKLRWAAIYASLLAGRIRTHEENFECPSPSERRTYKLRIRRQLDEAGNTAFLTHNASRVDGSAAPTVLAERLHALGRAARAPAEARAGVAPPDAAERGNAGIVTARHFAPLEEVGGDILWRRDFPDGTTDLVIADVMGHGRDAAQLAGLIVDMLDARSGNAVAPAGCVAAVNAGLVALGRPDGDRGAGPLFATGLYLRVDAAHRRLTYCSFGHSGPILSRSGYIEPPPGLPVGIVDEPGLSRWSEGTLPFAEHGARFTVFTDGVTEQFNLAGEMFGLARIERIFRETADAPVTAVVATVRKSLEAFRGDALVKDDQALLVVEALPA